MGMKDPNYYRFQHRQKGDLVSVPGLRVHFGKMNLDVEELMLDVQEHYLCGAADKPNDFKKMLKIIVPEVYKAALAVSTPTHDGVDEIRLLFVNGPDSRLSQT